MATNFSAPIRRLRRTPKHSQSGVVLFISLIVLVAMSLAGIALLRSVDTTVMVSGNIALKQATILGADRGTQAAVEWLEANSKGAVLQSTDSSVGYFASLSLPDPKWFDANVWNDAPKVNGGVADTAGNKTSYLIHRQCKTAGFYEVAGCSALQYLAGGAALTEGDSFRAGASAGFAKSKNVYYRITSRVEGPRNTVSIVQTTVEIRA